MKARNPLGLRQPLPPAGAPTPPTLVVHGELDRVIPPANAAPLAERWPGARVELLSGCGHALMAQEPDRIVDLIGSLTA